MPIGKRFRTALGLMFAASTSSLDTELMYVAGASRYRSCLCDVQPYDSRFRPLHSQTCRWRERRLTMDATTNPSTRWPRSCLGCLLHYTLRFRQLAEAYQTDQAGQHRNSIVQPCRQLVQEVLPALPPSCHSHNPQLVHLPVWCIRNSEEFGCILAADYKPSNKRLVGTSNYRPHICHQKHLALQSRKSLRPASMGSHVSSARLYVRIYGVACDRQPHTSISSDDYDDLLVLVVELGDKDR